MTVASQDLDPGPFAAVSLSKNLLKGLHLLKGALEERKVPVRFLNSPESELTVVSSETKPKILRNSEEKLASSKRSKVSGKDPNAKGNIMKELADNTNVDSDYEYPNVDSDLTMIIDDDGNVQVICKDQKPSDTSTTSTTSTSSSMSSDETARKKPKAEPKRKESENQSHIWTSSKTGNTYHNTNDGIQIFNEDKGRWIPLEAKNDPQPGTSTGGPTKQGRSSGGSNKSFTTDDMQSNSWTNLQTADVQEILSKVAESSPHKPTKKVRINEVDNMVRELNLEFDSGPGKTQTAKQDEVMK